MQMILFRHGIAKERGTRMHDADRELTDRGKEKLRTAAAGLRELLRTDQGVFIWASPYARTAQTAELLHQELGGPEIMYDDFLVHGSFAALEEKVQALAEAETCIVVGHSPWLDVWCEKICNDRIELKKGGAVAIEIKEKTPLRGDIIWLMQPKGWMILSHR